MRNLMIAILMLSAGLAMADEYSKDSYNDYGFGSAASVLNLGLKGGLRGAHVASNHHQQNSYYPGFLTGEARTVVAESATK